MESLDFDFGFVNSNYDKSRAQRRANIESRPVYYASEPRRGSNRYEKYNKDGDSFKTSRPSKKEPNYKLRIAALALTLIMGAGGIVYGANKKPAPNYPTNGHSISEIAEFTGIDPNVILLANKMKETDKVPDKIVLPEKYDILKDKTSYAEKKLQDENFQGEDRLDMEAMYETLKEVKEKQDEMADVYLSYGDIYIVPKSSVKVENLKETFGIPDSIITKYNDVGPVTYKHDKYGAAYVDYTNAYAKKGKAIVVPLKDFDISMITG